MKTPVRKRAFMALALCACGCNGGLYRGDASVDAVATGDACAPRPADAEELTIAGHFGPLGGTLELPGGCGPAPLVIFYSGSDTTDRDGATPRSYLALALALKEAGVATLRWDDEGVGASEGALPSDPRRFNYEHQLEDSVAWVRRFIGDRRFSQTFLLGHSQGSLTAALVAANATVGGVISLAGTSQRAGQLLVSQTPSSATAAERQAVIDSVASLETGREVDPATLPPRVAGIFPTEVQPYYVSWFAYDPLVAYRSLRVPALIVHGSTDRLVPPAQADELAAAAPDATLRIIDSMAHTLKHAESDAASQRAAQSDPSVALADGLVDAIVTWVRARDAR